MIAISCCLNCTTLSCLNCTTLCCLCCPTLSCLWIFLLCWCCAALLTREGSLLRRRGSFEKKMAAGRHVKDDKKGARLYARNFFFFYWTVLHIQFHLAWQLMQKLQTNCIWWWTCRDSQHVGLAPSRHTICNTYNTEKFTRKKFYKTRSSQQVGFAVFSQQTNNCQAKKFI